MHNQLPAIIGNSYSGIFPRFSEILPRFSTNQNFWGCACTHASYTTALGYKTTLVEDVFMPQYDIFKWFSYVSK